ncbi:MAG: class I SAM-dependent methyltransferase [Microcystaceae cyanobacterium]
MSQPPTIYPGEVFADTTEFDSSIRQLVPRYDEMLDVIVSCVSPQVSRILELGCGTGELSLKLLKRCPQAKLIALDYSLRMMEAAKAKITAAGSAQRYQVLEMDFGEWAEGQALELIGTEFEACVSSLAIHHLSNEMKLKLFGRIHQSLNDRGGFFNGDPVLAESPQLGELDQSIREAWAEQQGVTRAEVQAKLGRTQPYGYSSPDRLATLEDHLVMLKKAGFNPVAVPWKYYGLAVFGGWV